MIQKVFKSILLGALPLLAAAFLSHPAEAGLGKVKKASLWGHHLTYQFTTIQNPKVAYDGTAYVYTRSDGSRENRVILNTVFFKREAIDIWNDFQAASKPGKTSSMKMSDLFQQLTEVGNRLEKGKKLSGKKRKELISQLESLKEELKYAAWYDTYKRALSRNKTSGEAQKDFIRQFIQIRMKTIEYHELSHLLDEIRWAKSSQSRTTFFSQTEVRAFITELAYGANPQDSLWQVASGVIDEIKRGKNLDSSVSKLKGVLGLARNLSLPASKNSLTGLCHLSRKNSQQMATQLYRRYRQST